MQKENDFWQKYKSGTDIRFTALDTPAGKKNIDGETIEAITSAFVYWLSAALDKESLIVAIGHDSRTSATEIKKSCIDALKRSGCTILDCGLCSTPSMFEMTQYKETHADGSIMITASHHPSDKNGLKFFSKFGGLESSDIAKVLEFACGGRSITAKNYKYVRKDYMALYCDKLVTYFRKAAGENFPLKGLKIVVDAGNGAGGFFVDRVLKVLGADTAGSQFLEPDGNFPNHVPNPENKIAMQSISKCVVDSRADLGIIFDTDVDRAAVVAPDGSEINRNKLIALMSSIILSDYPGATIVTDSVTSDGLTDFIIRHKGDHHRFKRGYKNVINEAIELNRMGVPAPIAIETSGHAALQENHFLDDGAFLVVKILITMCTRRKEGKSLLSLIGDLREPLESAEIRLGFSTDAWRECGEEVLERLKKIGGKKHGWHIVPKTYEGVRISTKTGFFLLRMSVHDPILPVNIEDTALGGVKDTAKKLYKLLKKHKGLKLENLQAVYKKKKTTK